MGKTAFISSSAMIFLQRRAFECAGLLMIIIGLLLLLILGSYDPQDPSFNTSVSTAPANLLGSSGALLADLFLQTLGLAAFSIPLLLSYFGWKVIRHRHRHGLGKAVLLSLGTVFILSSLFALIPMTGSWSFSGSFGGIMGYVWTTGLHLLTGAPKALVAIITAGAATLLFLLIITKRGVVRWLERRQTGGKPLKEQSTPQEPSPPPLKRRSEPHLGNDKTILKRPLLSALDAATLYADDDPAALSIDRTSSREVPPKPTAAAIATIPLVKKGLLPPLSLLQSAPRQPAGMGVESSTLNTQAKLLESVLDEFGIKGKIVHAHPGPVVTLYELEPSAGTKSSRVIGLADDIARSMCATSARVAIIPGRNAIGIELPNPTRLTVYLKELLTSPVYEQASATLPLALGKDIGGTPIIADLAKMPHLLLAGTTGSGKSVAVNTMILSLLYRLPPERCRFIMIDPKMLELSIYDGIPHLLSPVVTDPRKAVVALKWTVREMEERYRAMSSLGVRNIEGYNQRLREARESGTPLLRRVQTGFDPDSGKPIFENQPLDLTELPYIVVVVDEMADLMLVAGKDIEATIQRLAQMARAAGIHLIMATQRPSVDVITGTIKANFPSRISFQVTSKIDSRTILSEQGAEQLLGQGDMLYMAAAGRIIRVHGPFVSDREVEAVVTALKGMGQPQMMIDVTALDEETGDDNGMGSKGTSPQDLDPLFDQAVALICREKKASTSFIQRHFQIGYNRAARMMDQMEAQGIVGSANQVGRREILARTDGDT